MPGTHVSNQSIQAQADREVLIGRQPILDRYQQIHAYELLFRQANSPAPRDGGCDTDTVNVLNNCLNIVGFDELVGSASAFVNLTRTLLLEQVYMVLPVQSTVVELLETIKPDKRIVSACEKLKQEGYRLALDDFVYHPDYDPLLELADYVKVDFLLSDANQRGFLVDKLAGRKIHLLAEKIETQQQYEESLNQQYAYFQGFYFCEPQIVSGRNIPGLKHNYLNLLQQINQDNVDLDLLEQIIKQDVSLSYKLLRYLNSAALGIRNQITSIKHAMLMLGLQPLKRWASLVAMTVLADDKPAMLMILSLARARFCEQIAHFIGYGQRELDLFMMGLCSKVDALLDRSMDELLVELPLPVDVKVALLGGEGKLADVHRLADACERAQWLRVTELASKTGIQEQQIAHAHRQSLVWADQVSCIASAA